MPPDPLRTRVHFLSILSPPRRTALLADAIAELRRHLETLKPGVDDDHDDCRALDGAATVMHARIAWLARLLRDVARTARG